MGNSADPSEDEVFARCVNRLRNTLENPNLVISSDALRDILEFDLYLSEKAILNLHAKNPTMVVEYTEPALLLLNGYCEAYRRIVPPERRHCSAKLFARLENTRASELVTVADGINDDNLIHAWDTRYTGPLPRPDPKDDYDVRAVMREELR